MRYVLGLLALLLALFTGWLMALTLGPALVPNVAESLPGQLRGLAFSLGMGAVTVGLLWTAARSFGLLDRHTSGQPKSPPSDTGH